MSDTPELLIQVIRNCANIDYNENELCISFSKNIQAEELMALDAVIKHPLILFEKVAVESMVKNNIDDSWYINDVRKEFGL